MLLVTVASLLAGDPWAEENFDGNDETDDTLEMEEMLLLADVVSIEAASGEATLSDDAVESAVGALRSCSAASDGISDFAANRSADVSNRSIF